MTKRKKPGMTIPIRECGCRADTYHNVDSCKLGREEADRRNSASAERNKQVLKWMRRESNGDWDL